MGTAEARATPHPSPPLVDGGRTAADVTALLVELGRLLKARQFYPDRHPLLRDAFVRGFQVFEAEVRRGGPLELDIRQGCFRLAGEPIGRGRVDELAQELVQRAVRALRFDGTLTPAALEQFIGVLAMEPQQLERSGGFVKALYADPCSGVAVNEIDYAAALAQAGASPAQEGQEITGEMDGPGGPGSGPDGGADAYAGDAGDGNTAALGLLGEPPKAELLEPIQQLEQAPLDAISGDDRADELIALLRDLDSAREDAQYRDLSREAAVRGAALADDGLEDEGYRAILVLASHAADRARTEASRAMALECLRELARGRRLDALIERACDPGEGVSLRAAQVILQLGETVVSPLLRRVETEPDLDRRGQLLGILIALGDATTPDLCAAMHSGDRRRAGVAVRLAGEMQNAGTVGELTALLGHPDADLRREAAKALVRVGSPDAIEALAGALRSPHEDMPGHAAFCLGVAGGTRALEVLLSTARREGGSETLDLAREAVRGLGRMGRHEAVPVLVEILERRSFLRRRRLRELHLAAVAALAKLPGEAARTALETAARRGDSEVREAARHALGPAGMARAELPSHPEAGA